MAITNAMIEQYQHLRIKLVIGSYTLRDTDLIPTSFNFRSGVSAGAFAPGGCVVASANFTIKNNTGAHSNRFAIGTQIEIYAGYGASFDTAEWQKLSTVYVADIKKRNHAIALQCYDKLRDADKKRWTTFSFPMTASAIISSAAAEAGITVGSIAYGSNITVDLRDDDGNQPSLSLTCRQAISAALLISGQYGYVNADGALVCNWFSSTADATIPTNWLFDYNISDSQAYTGVQVYGQQPTGTTNRLYVLSSGTFVTEDNCAAIQARLYAALVGTPCYSAQLTAAYNPNIKPGMMVSFTYPQAGSSVTSLIPLTSLYIHAGLKATYGSDAISADEADDLRGSKEEQVAEEVVNNAFNNYHPAGDFEFIKIYGGPFELTPDAYRPGYAIDELFGHWAMQGTQPESLRNVGKQYKMLLHNVNDTLETTWFTNYKLYPVGTMIVPTASSVQRAATVLGVDPTLLWFTVPLSVELIAHVPKDDQQSGYVVRGGGVSVIFEAVGVFSWEGYSLHYGPNLRLRSVRITGSKTGPLGTATIADLDYPNIVDSNGHTYEDVFGDSADYDLISDPYGRPLQTFSLNTVDGFPLNIPSTAYLGLVPTDQFSGLPPGQRMWMRV